MSKKTGIAWCDFPFNPWRGCQKLSAGCRNCYAEQLVGRFRAADIWGLWGPPPARRLVTSDAYWRAPLRWARAAKRDPLASVRGAQAPGRRLVFCGSMCDWAEGRTDVERWRPRLFKLIRETADSLDWLLLTKRADRIAACLPADWGRGYPNVWLGASVEGFTESAGLASHELGVPCGCWQCVIGRVDALRDVPAAVRFISYEPAIGPLAQYLRYGLAGIDWVICGGESGPRHRPFDPQWARDMRDKCDRAGAAWFFKQSGGARPGTGIALDGEIRQAWPVPRVVL